MKVTHKVFDASKSPPRKKKARKPSLTEQLMEAQEKLSRARALFGYLNLDPTEVIDKGYPCHVFVQLKTDLEALHKMSKEGKQSKEYDTVVVKRDGDRFSVLDAPTPKQKAYFVAQFSLHDIASFLLESKINSNF